MDLHETLAQHAQKTCGYTTTVPKLAKNSMVIHAILHKLQLQVRKLRWEGTLAKGNLYKERSLGLKPQNLRH
jgi:hypothetical protein